MTRIPASNNLIQNIQQMGKAGQPGQQMPAQRLGANQYGPSVKQIAKGSLVTFNYLYHKPGHDPAPLVIITDIWQNYIRGINLHYLTFPIIKNILQSYCDNVGFSYSNIRGDEYIVSAFRQYKRLGIRQIKKLDCAFLLNVLASVRTFDPNEVEAIRKSVRQQIRQLTFPWANPTQEEPFQST